MGTGRGTLGRWLGVSRSLFAFCVSFLDPPLVPSFHRQTEVLRDRWREESQKHVADRRLLCSFVCFWFAVWAEKEMRNLKRLENEGVRCPRPIEVRENVLAMEFLGDDEGW